MTQAISDATIRVVAGPANYFSHPDAIARLRDFYTTDQLNRACWLHGQRALAAARPYLPAEFDLPGARHLAFDGHCSAEEVAELAQQVGDDCAVIIGLGGGRVLDTAKALARQQSLPFVAIPTIAATCAAWTPLSVWYNRAGEALGFEMFAEANQLVLVEPNIILQAPTEYLLAGIGDTLAKWYEAMVLSPQPSRLPLTVRLGLDAARTIRDLLLTQSELALAAQANHTLTSDFVDVVDAIIAGGGLVGGLGDRYTRLAAAHAIHNGLTVLPQTNRFLHGTKVAYGILVQMALLEDLKTCRQLVAAFQRFHLPCRLAELDVDIHAPAELLRFVRHTLRPSESIHLLPMPITETRLIEALHQVETLSEPTGHVSHEFSSGEEPVSPA